MERCHVYIMTSTNAKICRVTVPFVGNPPVSGKFLPQRDSNADLWCLFLSVWTNCWTLDWLVIPDILTVIWHCRNGTWKGGKCLFLKDWIARKRLSWHCRCCSCDIKNGILGDAWWIEWYIYIYISTYENLFNNVNILSLLSCTTYDRLTSVWIIHW